MAIRAELQIDKRERPEELTGDQDIVTLDTKLVPIGLTIFPVEYVSLKLTSTHVKQTGRLQVAPGSNSLTVDQGFWLSDLSFDYRLPGRRGIVAIGGSNIFNHKIVGYQEVDAANPRFAQGRLVFGRFTLQF